MKKGPYRRLTGILRLNGRSPILETSDNGLLRLATSEDLSAFADQQVIIEGDVRSPNQIDLNWIGPIDTDAVRQG